MWAISCSITTARSSRSASVTSVRKMKWSSLNVTTPGFSIAPRLNSGRNTWSYFGKGKGTP